MAVKVVDMTNEDLEIQANKYLDMVCDPEASDTKIRLATKQFDMCADELFKRLMDAKAAA